MITGQREPPFHIGVVESRDDPLKIGRVRVRVVGLHTHDKTILPTEDLPWCYCIQPINSAAISGIGQAPVGPIEGTWVAVQYLDQDKQNPFVVGTLPGIAHQQTFFNNAPSQGGNYEVKPDGAVIAPWVDYSGAPIGDGKFNPAGTYQTSEAMVEKIKQRETFRSKPYDDGAGVWTIGYGTTYIDGAKVSKNTPEISEGRALELFKNDLVVVENSVKSVVTVPVTQSMFDAMVSLSYNIGGGAFRKSSVVRELNARNYEKAGDHFRDWKYAGGKVMAGLETRRNDERSWFMREGLGENNDITVASAEMLAVDGSQQLVETEPSTDFFSLSAAAPDIDAQSDEANDTSDGTQETKVVSVRPVAPITRILDFGSASGMVLDPKAKAAIVATGAVKMLTKEEFLANVVANPPEVVAIVGGGGGGGGGGTTSSSSLTLESNDLDFAYIFNQSDTSGEKYMKFVCTVDMATFTSGLTTQGHCVFALDCMGEAGANNPHPVPIYRRGANLWAKARGFIIWGNGVVQAEEWNGTSSPALMSVGYIDPSQVVTVQIHAGYRSGTYGNKMTIQIFKGENVNGEKLLDASVPWGWDWTGQYKIALAAIAAGFAAPTSAGETLAAASSPTAKLPFSGQSLTLIEANS